MIHILSANDRGIENGGADLLARCQQPEDIARAALSSLGIERLVLQPMDPRLEYLRDLRVWLRENGWQIMQVREVMPSAGQTESVFSYSGFCFLPSIYSIALLSGGDWGKSPALRPKPLVAV